MFVCVCVCVCTVEHGGAVCVSACVCLCVHVNVHLPILNSLLAIRISAFGMMGGGRQNCSLYAGENIPQYSIRVCERSACVCVCV